MLKDFDKEEIELMTDTIDEYLSECEFGGVVSKEKCRECADIECCYTEANMICNDEFAESIDFGGYDSAEEFWDNLFD